jgi:hypothetical protein
MASLPMQLTFPFAPEVPGRGRRCAWRAELARQASFFADQRARDRAMHAQELARIDRQIEDIRSRLVDLERGEGAADLSRAPVRKGELMRFAR